MSTKLPSVISAISLNKITGVSFLFFSAFLAVSSNLSTMNMSLIAQYEIQNYLVVSVQLKTR